MSELSPAVPNDQVENSSGGCGCCADKTPCVAVVVSDPRVGDGDNSIELLARATGADFVSLASVGDSVAAVIAADLTGTRSGKLVIGGTGASSFDADCAAALGAGLLLVAQPAAAAQAAADATSRGAAVVTINPDHVDEAGLISAFNAAAHARPVIGPEAFAHWLTMKARAKKTRIVLPEGDDDRILKAAHQILADDICELIILGDPETITARAAALNLDVSAATLDDPAKSSHAEAFAEQFAELRKSKGVTLEQARETMKDISYFATMMIHTGLADGMVSGAAHTTAHTIKPSFQIIKTLPGVSTVSSIFLMVMPGKLWAFGDCAVNPNPTAEQLAEIAAVSAHTASCFGIDPKVAMLSYSTGTSGSGPDVDRATAAAAAARAANPTLAIDGPLQFDAAVDPGVAAKKAPDSPVAGAANVLIFPDLEAGNIAYKAVQRTAGALAVGPILQGLKKPVNDLSRGATVDDIINTVAITAIQAQGE